MTRLNQIDSVLLACLLTVFVGCSSDKTIDAEQLANAQVAYDSAIDEIAAGNTEAALTALDQALQPGAGLPADIAVDAMIQRAICLARVGRCADAHADLDIASEGAGDMSAVHVARSFVFKKEGKDSDAKSEMRIARRYNKSAKAIKE